MVVVVGAATKRLQALEMCDAEYGARHAGVFTSRALIPSCVRLVATGVVEVLLEQDWYVVTTIAISSLSVKVLSDR